MRLIALGLLIATAVGCEEKKEEPKPAPAAVAPAPAAPPPAAAAPADPAAAPVPGAAAAAPGTANPANAAAAAAALPEGSGPPCEQAYTGIEAMIKSMEKSMPAGAKSTGGGLPPKEKFLAGCKELPETMQKCMVMSYGMAHQKECMDAKAKMDPATAAKVKAIMGK